jgi:hypothetical protein
VQKYAGFAPAFFCDASVRRIPRMVQAAALQ